MRSALMRSGWMWRCSPLLGGALLVISSVSAAAGEAPRPLPASAGTAAAAPAGQLTGRKAEIDRLQKHVASLEQKNSEASTRLQKQDQDIAELRRQLQAVQAQPAQQH